MNVELKSKLINVINSFDQFVKNDEEIEFLKLSFFVKLELVQLLNDFIDKSNNRIQAHGKIDEIIKMIKGPNFTLTPHGISKTIDGRYNFERKKEIVSKINEFSKHLMDKLKIESFITSGTLLGLVRENAFLGHDDDFDVAYISNYYNREKILEERLELHTVINKSKHFIARERTGGRFAITAKCTDFNFNFDLFTSWGDKDGYFNEFPLRPKTVFFKDISPVKTVKFYESDINVPKNPACLLEVNYGPGWKVPDPSFRFKYGEHQPYYRFLMNNKIEDKKS